MGKNTADTETMDGETSNKIDPNEIIVINAFSATNANKKVGTRWGKVAFDAEGHGDVKLPAKDIVHLHDLRWLSKEDQDKYLGIVEPEVVYTDDALAKELAGTKEACARLAIRNAELESTIAQRDAQLSEMAKHNAELQRNLQQAASRIVSLEKDTKKDAKKDAKKDEKKDAKE